MSGQHHALTALYPQGKDYRYPLDRRLRASEPVWTQGLEEKSFAPARDIFSLIYIL
jgi:hypothetical protein